MLFTVPASTIIGLLLMIAIFAVIELLGWLSGYRPALVTWTLSEEHTGEALARAVEQAAGASGFTVVWSKDHTFVATRDVGQGARRLSLLPGRRAHTRTLKLAVHGTCIWETGETEELAALARNIVRDAAAHEPWIAQSASSSTTGA
jgi:glycerophosphoryl diester phosphodiesterase